MVITVFSLNSPLHLKEFPGKNIYGILRAPRGASTEALVMSAPYRPKGGEFSMNNGAMAVMLGMAKFFRSKRFIVFQLMNKECLRSKFVFV